jgi:hypothetical protein
MEPTSFELTPAQKGILATLSRVTGKSIPALLDEALEVLQDGSRPTMRLAWWIIMSMVYRNARYETAFC